MTGVEITLILVGIIFVLVSFFVQEKLTPKDVQEITRLSEKELKIIVERELKNANDKVEDAIDAVVEQSQENAKRLMEKETNEKIMAINEYSNTVIESMNKTHNEILFLYNMLNDKHKNLKETVQQVDKTAKEAEEKANAAATALAATSAEEPKAEKKTQEPVKTPAKKSKTSKPAQEKRKDKDQHITLDMLESVLPKEQLAQLEIKEDKKKNEPEQFQALQPDKLPEIKEFSFAEQAPHIERPQNQESQAANLENTVSAKKDTPVEEKEESLPENNNDKILRLHKQGMSSVDIAKELGLGVGEVKLVINLFKGA